MNRFALFLASLVPAVGGLWMATEKFASLVAYDPAFLGSSLTSAAPISTRHGLL